MITILASQPASPVPVAACCGVVGVRPLGVLPAA